MKKLFFFFAAMMVTLAVSATPLAPGTGVLDDAISDAEGVLELATGEFIETSSIGISKDIVIKAAEGATPIIKAKGFGIQGGARVTFQGIKFDASSTPSHLIYANDASDGNELILEGCEIYDYDVNSSMIHCGSSQKLDSIIVNNCYVHNIKKSFIFHEGESLKGLNVTNSTIANVTTVTGSYYASIINPFATDVKVKINNCTFYNCEGMASDHGAVRVPNATDVTVSNCIFMMPSSYAGRAVIIKGGNVKNCLLRNFTKGTKGIHTDSPWSPSISDCIDSDPLFADAPNGNYTPNEEDSPAKAAGIGGSPLGDPRWWPASWQPAEIIEVTGVTLDKTELALQVEEVEQLTATVLPDNASDKSVSWSSSDKSVATVVGGLVTGVAAGTATITATAGGKTATCEVTVTAATIPEVKLTSTYTLAAKVARLEGKVWKMYEDEKYKIYGDGDNNEKYGNALWTINVTNPCIISASVMDLGGGALYELDVFQGEDSITTVIQPESSQWWSGVVDMTGTMTLSKAGEYTFRLRNTLEWSSGKTSGIMLSYESALPQTLYLKPNDNWKTANAKFAIWDITNSAWSAFMTLAENETDIYTATIAADAAQVIFVRINPELDAPDWGEGKSWTQTGDLTLLDGKYLFTINNDSWTEGSWSKYNYVSTLEDGWYLVGTFNNVEEWTVDKLTAAKKFAANPSDASELIVTATLVSGDEFKAAYVYQDEITEIKPSGTGNNYVVDNNHAGVNKTIYYSVESKQAWGGHFYVKENGGTAIDNANANAKAVKSIVNSQLLITRDGKTYNVLGTIVK